jgi:hypothetical protein
VIYVLLYKAQELEYLHIYNLFEFVHTIGIQSKTYVYVYIVYVYV